MQLSNCLLALGGDRENTVPKYDVTPAEIQVMQAIHGADAVFDVEPSLRVVRRSARDEIERLKGLYPAQDDEKRQIVTLVFPGTGAGMPTTLDHLGLDPTLFKVLSRMTSMARTEPVGTPMAPMPDLPSPPNAVDDFFDDEGGDDLAEDDPVVAAMAG